MTPTVSTRHDHHPSAEVTTTPSPTAHWAAVFASLSIVVLLVGYAILIAAAVIGATQGVHPTWRGPAGGHSFWLALGLALVGFVLAIRARLSHEASRQSRLALYLFPILLAVLIVVDVIVF